MKNIILIFCLIIFASCSSIRLRAINIVPVKTDNEYWKDGQLYQRQIIDNIIVDVGLIRDGYSTIIFDIIIENRSDLSFEVIPELFYMNYFSSGENSRNFVYQPEYLLKQKNAEIRRLEPQPQPNLSEMNLESDEITKEIRLLRRSQERFQEYILEKERLEKEYQYLINNLLRKNTLRKGEKISGIIFVDKKLIDKSYELNIMIGNKNYKYKYNVRSEEK